MATFYVDYVGGADSNVGTDSGHAWKHCPGDVNATGNPASATLAAGDIVYFKKGVSYLGQVTCGQSGASVTTGGTGSITALGVLTDAGASFQTANVQPGQQVYIYHFKLSVFGTWVESCGLFTVASVGSQTQLTLSDFNGVAHATAEMTYVISNPITYKSLSSWGTGDAIISGEATRNYGFDCETKSFLRFDSIKFYNMAAADYIRAAIYGRELAPHIYTVSCKFDTLAASSQWTGNYSIFKNCICTSVLFFNFLAPDFNSVVNSDYQLVEGNSCNGGTRSWSAGYCGILRYNTILNLKSEAFTYHEDGIGPIGNARTSYIWIYGNTVDDTVEFFALYGTDAYSDHIVIHDNLVIGRYGTTGYGDNGIFGRGSQYVYIYNNTFVGPSTKMLVSMMIIIGESVAAGDHWVVENNIFVTTDGRMIEIGSSGATNFACDYNHYVSLSATPFVYSLAYHTYADWKGLGYDAHSIADLATDPLFVDNSYATLDAHLQVGSPDIGIGVNFSTMFTLDKDKNVRPASGAWDLGAYEYRSGGGSGSFVLALK